MPLATTAVTNLLAELAARTPTPGGGAAAAMAAALGCAAGAMAARYTSGPRHAAVAEDAQRFGDVLVAAAAQCVHLGDADAEAFAAVGAARKAGDADASASAAARAAAVPADLLALCALHAAGLVGFMPTANQNLLSDVKVGIHLLAGAGRAAWQTLLVNQPADGVRRIAAAHLAALDAAERQALGTPA